MAGTLAYNMNLQDDMEISSDVGQRDVDFDIDFFIEDADIQKEDEMLEDATVVHEQEDIELRSATDNNDYMVDDAVKDDVLNSHGGFSLENAGQHAADEDLLDLSEEDIVAPAEVQEPDGDEAKESDHKEMPSAIEDLSDQESLLDFEDDIHDVEEKGKPSEGSLTETAEPHSESRAAQGDLITSVPSGHDTASVEASAEGEPLGEDESTFSLNEGDGASGSADERPESAHGEYQEEHSTFTGLHQTLVKYRGRVYLLFPSNNPSEGEVYLLQDENLVSGCIDDLLKALRVALADDITDDYELELHVEHMDLYVSEDSKAAFFTSFVELLNLFVLLHRNDGTEHPPTMAVNLLVKPRFANRWPLLANTVNEGFGFSHLHNAYGQIGGDSEAVEHDERVNTLHETLLNGSGEEAHGLLGTDAGQVFQSGGDLNEEHEEAFSIDFGEASGSQNGDNDGPSAHEDSTAVINDSSSISHSAQPVEGDEVGSDTSKPFTNDEGDDGEEAEALSAAPIAASPSEAPSSIKHAIPPLDEDDEIDFDDDYDSKLGVMTSRTKATAVSTGKRGLDEVDFTTDDLDIKRRRPGD